MTPDDLAERRNWDSAAWRHRDIVLLMDALEQAWALAESRREEANRWAAKFGQEQARAERAEAELEAFRDSGLFEMWTQDRARAEQAEAALDRVRDLCELVETYDHPVAWHTEIRAAIEEGQ